MSKESDLEEMCKIEPMIVELDKLIQSLEEDLKNHKDPQIISNELIALNKKSVPLLDQEKDLFIDYMSKYYPYTFRTMMGLTRMYRIEAMINGRLI